MKTAEITDFVLWFKHIDSAELVGHLNSLGPNESIFLEAEDVVGQWRRMESGKDGRPTPGIKPVGPMKEVWKDWYRNRRGDRITLRPVVLADDFIGASTSLFPEWDSPEDDEAFRDL